MRRLSRFVLPAIAASVVTLVSAEAGAFCRTTTCRDASCPTDDDGCVTSGHGLFWPTSCVGYSVDARLSRNLPEPTTRAAIARSFMAWADLECEGGGRATLTFSPLADTTCSAIGSRKDGPNVNVITFRDDDWTYRGIDNSLAKTTVTFDASTGAILDADIEINTATNPVTVSDGAVQYDLQSILTHEIGHLIGIAHTPDPDATMYASYEPGTIDGRTLGADDVRAVCAIYPPGREAACAPEPRNGLARSCDAAASGDGDEGGCTIGRGRVRFGLGASFVVLTLLGAGARRRARRPLRP